MEENEEFVLGTLLEIAEAAGVTEFDVAELCAAGYLLPVWAGTALCPEPLLPRDQVVRWLLSKKGRETLQSDRKLRSHIYARLYHRESGWVHTRRIERALGRAF